MVFAGNDDCVGEKRFCFTQNSLQLLERCVILHDIYSKDGMNTLLLCDTKHGCC